MSSQPQVCIIVLNWNGENILTDCVRSLFNNTAYENFKIIIVDNGSIDMSAEQAHQRFPQSTLVKLKENFGFSKGMNVGAWYALQHYAPQYVMFLNNDITIPKNQRNWLSNLVDDLECDPHAASSSPQIKKPNGEIDYVGWRLSFSILGLGKLKPNKTRKKCYVEHGSGACLLIKAKVLNQIGLFDEKFSPFYYEDHDLFLRIKHAEYKTIYDPTHTVRHITAATASKYKERAWLKYKIIYGKNAIRYAYLHSPFYLFILTILVSIVRLFIDIEKNKVVIRNYNLLSIVNLIRNVDLGKAKINLTKSEAVRRIDASHP